VVPGVYVANDAMHEQLGKRRPFLTAKRLLSNQTFRELYRTDTLDVDQRLKITSLTKSEDLLLKIGIHEGPCLAVTLNDRQDYFGQTVNIASRVQGLAVSRSILATGAVVDHPQATRLLETDGIKPTPKRLPVRGVAEELAVYEIP
jgi:hypothetical protein